MKNFSAIYTYTAFAIVMGLLFLYEPINNHLFDSNMPGWFSFCYIILALLIIGSPGIVYILRKETISRGFAPIRGKIAVIIGILWVGVWYGFAIFLIITVMIGMSLN